jgi:replicative superfamily II helicase
VLGRLWRGYLALHEGDEISYSFIVAPLDYEPNYEALSYVWGDPENVRSVLVNGHSKRITVNLHSALTLKASTYKKTQILTQLSKNHVAEGKTMRPVIPVMN